MLYFNRSTSSIASSADYVPSNIPRSSPVELAKPEFEFNDYYMLWSVSLANSELKSAFKPLIYRISGEILEKGSESFDLSASTTFCVDRFASRDILGFHH